MKFFTIAIFILLFGLTQKSLAQNIQISYQPCMACPQAASSNPAVADPLYGYGAATPFVTGDIESDYDLRHFNSSRWHNGIDLRNHPVDLMRNEVMQS